jgi:lambda family phage portal protein
MGILDRIFRRTDSAPAAPPAVSVVPVVPRRTAAVIAAARNFEAAWSDRLTASWRSPNLTANEEIKGALEATRNRARDLAKNNEFARKYLSLVVANVVGPSGFALQNLSAEQGKPDAAARNLIEASFAQWGRRGVCEISGRYSFCDVQRAVIETWARDGEALVLQLEGPAAGNAHGYALRLLEVERLPVQYAKDLAGGAQAVMGVEIDDLNRTVAYWLNLGRLTSSSQPAVLTRVPAHRVIHVFKPYRPEQVRGFPSMHAVIAGLKMLDGYEEAAIVAARTGAAKMGFFTNPDGDGAALGDDKDDDGNFITDADPGSFQVLPKGYDFKEFNPDYPHANYQAFMKTRLRSIASGLGITYHGLANDLEGVNFSSIRSGTLEERDAWMVLQSWFIEAFMRPVYREWLRMALTSAQITFPNGSALPIAKYDKFAEHTWLGRRWGWVDPMKDIEASRLAIKSGIASPQMIAAQSGVDVEDVIAAIADFEKLVAASGISLVDYDKTAPAPAPEQPPAETATDKALAALMARAAEPVAAPSAPTFVVHNHPAATTVNMGETRNEITVPPAPPSPVEIRNEITLPEQAAPTVEVRVEAVMPEQAAPVVEVHVEMPDEMKITALPTRITTTDIQRDSAGNIKASTQTEKDKG